MKQRLVLAAVLAAAAVPLPAHAQAWVSDPRMSEGIGIRTGNLELHPGLGAEFGYDSNYFLRAGTAQTNPQAPDEHVVSVFRLRIVPSLTLSTLGTARRRLAPDAVTPDSPPYTFRAGIHLDYSRLFTTDSKYSDLVDHAQNPINVGANLRLDVAPQRLFGEDIHADFQRIAQASPDLQCLRVSSGGSCEATNNWNRDVVRAGAGITWRPGGGLFEWRLGYELGYNYFESELFRGYNNLQHAIQSRGRWRFLPRTALLYDGEYRFIRYSRDDGPHSGDILRARVGLNGLVTPRVSLLGQVGWQTSFYENVPRNADTVIATAEAKYFVLAPPGVDTLNATTGLSTVALGFTREVSHSYLSSYYTKTGGYASAVYFQGGVFVGQLDAGLYRYQFPQGLAYYSFNQNRINARAFLEYRLLSTIAVNGTVMFQQNLSDDLRPRTAAGFVDNLDYTRWQGFVGLRWFM